MTPAEILEIKEQAYVDGLMARYGIQDGDQEMLLRLMRVHRADVAASLLEEGSKITVDGELLELVG